MTDRGWNELLDELRALGGTADNLCLRAGPFGRGLFAEDPAKPVRLRIPPNVLVEVAHVVFEDGVFRVGPESKLDSRERAFVEKYEAEFSWGAGGRVETEEFFESAKALPEPARKILSGRMGLGFLFAEITPDLIQRRFLGARRINCNGRSVVMSIMDLTNYGHLADFDTDNGIEVSGQFPGEVLVRYSNSDSCGIFRGWGFASEESEAFSVNLRVKTELGSFVVSTKYDEPMSGPHPLVPKVKVEGREIAFSFLLLGNRKFPRLPKGIFCRAMKDAGYPRAEESFEYIRHANQLVLVDALEALEGVEGAMAQTLRRTLLWQLRTLSYCFGARDPLNPVALPPPPAPIR
ncbi:MAG TPA: hypothetical protein VII49_03150 [Rhizomicrobium sp.]